MRNSIRFVLFLVACACYLFGSSAAAWNSPGHMVVALVAYDQMGEATRVKAVELLRAHPRFSEHFEHAMPREVSRGDERLKDEWIFAYAATWPDVVRDSRGVVDRTDVSRYSRPYWHYVDFPIYLNDAERQRLEGRIRLHVDREPPPDKDDANMNIIQAVKNSSAIVKDRTAPKDDRAVHLCWLLHLTGDSHQPMHSSSLYTAHRFFNGDQGGNLLEIEHGWKLHGFWDDQVSNDDKFETLRNLVGELEKDQKLAAVGKQAAPNVSIDKWIDESHDLAKRFVYTEEVLKKVGDRETHTHLGPLNLPPAYRAAAEGVAERRAIQAAYRLAKLMEQLLD